MHLRRLIVLIINARNINDPLRSCTKRTSIIGLMFFSDASLHRFDRSDQKNQNSRTATVPPRGCRVKQTVSYLFTMSKYPVMDASRHQHNQTLLFISHAYVPGADQPAIHDPNPFQTKFGGARRDRTDDILLAKQALSQLSYGPIMGATN